jgi:hypothetical protein
MGRRTDPRHPAKRHLRGCAGLRAHQEGADGDGHALEAIPATGPVVFQGGTHPTIIDTDLGSVCTANGKRSGSSNAQVQGIPRGRAERARKEPGGQGCRAQYAARLT